MVETTTKYRRLKHSLSRQNCQISRSLMSWSYMPTTFTRSPTIDATETLESLLGSSAISDEFTNWLAPFDSWWIVGNPYLSGLWKGCPSSARNRDKHRMERPSSRKATLGMCGSALVGFISEQVGSIDCDAIVGCSMGSSEILYLPNILCGADF